MRKHGIDHHATESSVAQEAEAQAEDRVEVVADAERGPQGEADGARREVGGGTGAITHPVRIARGGLDAKALEPWAECSARNQLAEE